MSGLDGEIRACLRETAREGGAVRGRFIFPSGFVGFRGHFDGQPVLPGVCMIRAALILAEAAGCGTGELSEIASAKWYRPVSAGEVLDFSVEPGPNGAGPTPLRVRVTLAGERVADLRLAVSASAGDAAP